MTTEAVYLPIGYVAAQSRSGNASRKHVILADVRVRVASLCGQGFSGVMRRVNRRRADVTCAACLRRVNEVRKEP